MMYQFATVQDMLQGQTAFAEHDVAQVFGYYTPGDDMPRAYVFEKGAWRLCHNGQVDFRAYGVMGTDLPADDALDAMMNDPSVTHIFATTDLVFTRRHTSSRSGVTLDFGGHLVTAPDIEPCAHNDPFSALIHLTGRKTGVCQQVVLTHHLPELYDIFEVADASMFTVDSWWRVHVNNLAGREEKEIDKLLEVVETMDATHVRFNYKIGWALDAGRTLTYEQVLPVQGTHIRNMRFDGNGGGEYKGIQPLAMEYCVNCNVSDIHAARTYWPVLLRRHNVSYVTERCSLNNPVEVVVGGTGYLTQQIHCLYGAVRDCQTSNARHLNDFTGCAYCEAENNHGDGDFHGAFVTHGQFEHDLSFVGNSGLLSFANSGPTWGSTAKRITVVRHVGCWGIAFAKISDLTLRDVTIYKTEKYEQCGVLQVNADGAQIIGCQADELIFTQRSARSKRPNVVRDCYFTRGVTKQTAGDAAVTTAITVENTYQEGGKVQW